jgi:hypothetical protein
MTTTTAQDNAEIVRRAHEAFNTADLATLAELMDPQAWAPSWTIRTICSRSCGGRPAVAEGGGHLVSVPRASEVAQQPHPVDRVAEVPVEPGLLAHAHREEARAELGLEGLPDGVVLRQGERADQLPHPKGRRGHPSGLRGRRGRGRGRSDHGGPVGTGGIVRGRRPPHASRDAILRRTTHPPGGAPWPCT